VSSVLIGFVAAASLAFGLAFGLWGRSAAQEIIAEYLDKQNGKEKNLKNEK
jgi:cytochrome b